MSDLFTAHFSAGFRHASDEKENVFNHITDMIQRLENTSKMDPYVDDRKYFIIYAQSFGYVIGAFCRYPDALISQSPGYTFIKFLESVNSLAFEKAIILENLRVLVSAEAEFEETKTVSRIKKIIHLVQNT